MMIFYSFRSRYFLLVKITTRLAINFVFIGEFAYRFTHNTIFNHFLIDNNQLITDKEDCIASKSGISPALF
jgi:hypothetical protein